jgi:hypothetical protein
MPDRPYPAINALIRRVKRIAAERPDPTHILAETITLIGASDADPYAILGVLVEGAVHTVARHIPAERQADAASTLLELLKERLDAHGLPRGDGQV